MDSQIIYLKNRFYKLDPLVDSTMKSAELWADALFYNMQNDLWISDHNRTDETVKSKLVVSLNEKKWIRLVKRVRDGQTQFEQQGPFSDHEIFDMLKKSQATFNDPLWKKGLLRWTPIAKVETFKGLQDVHKQLESDSFTANILDSVIEMRRVESKHRVPPVFIEEEASVGEVYPQSDSHVSVTENRGEERKESECQEKSGHSFILRSVSENFRIERLLFALGVTLLFLFFMMKFLQ